MAPVLSDGGLFRFRAAPPGRAQRENPRYKEGAMLDLNFIREHADEVKKALVDLNTTAPIDEILQLDRRRRELLQMVESLRARRNTVSKEVPRIKDAAERERLVAEMRQVGDQIKDLEAELKTVEERLTAALYEVPNLPGRTRRTT
jgi:seryl-tRNA synthetase